MAIQIGETVPEFKFPVTHNKWVVLSALRGYNIVLYFYPKDDTPGCTVEAEEFRDAWEDFKAEHCVLLGVSRDSISSHEKFCSKYNLPFPLISDTEGELCTMFDVIKNRMMYGRETRGIERSTFLLDRNGVLRKEWRKIKAEGHAEQVLFAVQELNREHTPTC